MGEHSPMDRAALPGRLGVCLSPARELCVDVLLLDQSALEMKLKSRYHLTGTMSAAAAS